MRKITSEQENPIDNINVELCDYLCPFFHKLGFTPNGITTLSLLFGILSVFLLYKGYIISFGIFYYISYFFDCMDGHYARKYSMVSEGGDMYDHVKDILVYILLIAVFWYRNKDQPLKNKLIVGVIFVLLFLLMSSHLGCQEKITDNDDSKTLKFTKYFCPGDPEKNIKFTRWFGCGTFTVLTIIIIYLVETKFNTTT
jgi:phosphatidylglycerophosphate synthase